MKVNFDKKRAEVLKQIQAANATAAKEAAAAKKAAEIETSDAKAA